MLLLFYLGSADNFGIAHVGTECFGNDHFAVFGLVVFEDGGNGAAYGHAGTVQSMNEFGFAVGIAAEADNVGRFYSNIQKTKVHHAPWFFVLINVLLLMPVISVTCLYVLPSSKREIA